MIRRLLLSALIALGLLAPGAAPAADAPPRVGVVLGGGGARGFAHLGVLAELERLRIPIACMAGASAGALIGGFYASGQPLAHIRATFERTDWDRVLSGQLNRADLPFKRKRDDYRNYFDLLTGFRDGSLRLPRAAVSSQHIDQLMRELGGNVLVDSFAQLPIPFQAVATDLLTGDAYVFDHGDLAIAQRASMAVPGLFEPVELDGRLLVDGGMARQLPVENLQGPNGCADVIIAIDVGTPSLKREDIRSFVDVLAQYTQIGVLQNVRQQEQKLDLNRDVLIRPMLGQYTAADFKAHHELAELGRLAVQPHVQALSRYSVSEADYARWQSTRLALRPTAPHIDTVTIAAGSDMAPAASLAALKPATGQPLDSAHLSRQLDQAYASGDFERVGYRLWREDNRTTLELMPQERSVAPNYLRMGLGLTSGTDGQNAFNLLFSHQRIWLNAWGGEWRTELAFGHSPGAHSEWYQPLGADRPLFMALSARIEQHPLRIYLPGGEQLGSLNVRRQAVQAELGWSLGASGEARLGVFRGSERAEREVGDPAQFESGRAAIAGLTASLTLDQFDRPKLPREGYLLHADMTRAFSVLGTEQPYTHLNSRLDWAQTLGADTLRATLKYARTFARERIAGDQHGLGGFLNVSGMGPNQLLGQETLFARLMGYRQIAALPSAIGGGLYAGVSLEAGRVRHALPGLYARQGWVPAASAYLVADSLLGPLFLGVGKATQSGLMGYLYLGSDF